MAILESQSSLSKELFSAKEVLISLRNSYLDYKGENKGEFAKLIALSCGGWIEPETLVKDLLSIKQKLTSSQPPGFSSVQLMTLRKAKGLEADVVVMVGLEDDLIPGSSTDIEEQARLFYVGMTRAKKKLFMIHSFKRPRNVSFGIDIVAKTRSRFLDTIGIRSEFRKDSARTT